MNNFHTHTFRCKHATGDIEDYIAASKKAGLRALGFSDHTPLPDNRWPEIRMAMDELEGYVHALTLSKEKYPDLRIYSGLECEYDACYVSFYKEELLGRLQLDYLVGGTHFFQSEGVWQWCVSSIHTAQDLRRYTELFVEGMTSGLFAFMAHPDFFGVSYPKWDAEAIACSKYLLEAAESLKMPLEINVSGLLKPRLINPDQSSYPMTEFWELAADYHIGVIVGADAQHPDQIILNMDKGFQLADALGLQLIDPETCLFNKN